MELYILIVAFLCTPLWVFLVPLLILATMCVAFWKRTKIRRTCVAIGLLVGFVSLPFVIVQAVFGMDPDERLESGFDVAIGHDTIAKYRFKPAGLGDTLEFWKLRKGNVAACEQITRKHHLKPIASDKLFPPGSVGYGPWWWPRSTQGYSVFEGGDDFGGSMEVWISQDGSCAYLYRFLE
jgi:hypothetical protein